MKANRRFKLKEDEAVSAVIGVILMVAITVAIAATVYVYVSGMIGESPQTTPNLQMVRNNQELRLTVASADPGNLQWDNFEVTFDGILVSYVLDGTGDGADWDTYFTEESMPSGQVRAGDYIQVNNTVDYSGKPISIRHTPTNTLIGTWTFN